MSRTGGGIAVCWAGGREVKCPLSSRQPWEPLPKRNLRRAFLKHLVLTAGAGVAVQHLAACAPKSAGPATPPGACTASSTNANYIQWGALL
jgi:hypothetical protein